jgi:hypothetical protein
MVKKQTTKGNIKQRKPIRRPGPYRSQLIPHVDKIRAWRRSGKTWKQVTEELAKLDPPVHTDPATAYRFIMRWKKRPYPYGKDQAPEPAQAASPSPAPDQKAAGPVPPSEDNPKTSAREAAEKARRFNEERQQQQAKELREKKFRPYQSHE